MSEQPNALRLAEWLDSCKLPYDPNDVSDAAAELRRLHSVNAELLEALDMLLQNPNSGLWSNNARSAIAKATGETK